MKKAIVFDLGSVVFSFDGGSFKGREMTAEHFDIDKKSCMIFGLREKKV